MQQTQHDSQSKPNRADQQIRQTASCTRQAILGYRRSVQHDQPLHHSVMLYMLTACDCTSCTNTPSRAQEHSPVTDTPQVLYTDGAASATYSKVSPCSIQVYATARNAAA